MVTTKYGFSDGEYETFVERTSRDGVTRVTFLLQDLAASVRTLTKKVEELEQLVTTSRGCACQDRY